MPYAVLPSPEGAGPGVRANTLNPEPSPQADHALNPEGFACPRPPLTLLKPRPPPNPPPGAGPGNTMVAGKILGLWQGVCFQAG